MQVRTKRKGTQGKEMEGKGRAGQGGKGRLIYLF